MNLNNLLSKISVSCLSLITLILSIDFHFQIMPFNTVFLLLYVIFVLFVSIWVSFVVLQHILNQNKPFSDNHNVYKAIFARFKQTPSEEKKVKLKNIDERIEDFVRDIEGMFIKKWYGAYISEDEVFLRESRLLLDIIVRRFLQFSDQINSDKIILGVLLILLKHVKEYRRAVKKVKTCGGPVENNFRYSHIGSKSPKAVEHFSFQITSKLLRHFINWELYSSLASRCVSSILARKLVNYLLVYVSAPGFINHKLVMKFGKAEDLDKIEAQKFAFISVGDVDHAKDLKGEGGGLGINDEEDIVDSAVGRSEVEVEEKKPVEEVEKEKIPTMPTTPVATNRLNSEPVKIHESRATNKTWRNSSDLDCISLGQDILDLSDISDSDIQEIIHDKKLWKTNTDSSESIEEFKGLPVLKETFQEDLEIFGTALEYSRIQGSALSANVQNILRPATTGAATIITNTIRPIGSVTAHTMKEFQQSTVNNVMRPMSQATHNAMHKIGDLQDEAAGVVEGILDFGMAGIRKGLRLTGLQDVETQKPKSDSIKIEAKGNGRQKLTKLGHVNSDEVKIEEVKEETVWVNPLLKMDGSPSFEGEILLEKSPSADSRSMSSESGKVADIPTMEVVSVVDSPDPEYEDTTDLATTTAKLRSLLAQRTSESTLTTPAASPMSMIPTPLDNMASGSSLEELSEVDGALPSMYKAWAKTATGVFQNTINTLKTALPGNNEQEGLTPAVSIPKPLMEMEEKQWMFIQEDPQTDDLSQHMGKFLAERQVFCTIDNAYEAIEAMELTDQLDASLVLTQRQFDDELDDFDTTIPMSKALVDLVCELVEETYPPLVKENVVKVLLLTAGKVLEEQLHEAGAVFVKSVNGFIGNIPKFESRPMVMAMKIEAMVEVCLNIVPDGLLKVLNVSSVNSVLKLLLESLQSQRINQDTNLQILELLASEIISAASQSSPTYSA